MTAATDARRVYSALAPFVWRTDAELASRTRLSTNRVESALTLLRDAGLVEGTAWSRTRRRGDGAAAVRLDSGRRRR